ncbi:MAG TPA: hypothetical protein VMJ64_19050 [Anaerolineales bacterium]|nr:hypothetical protein [Anaerolineales bacterium]
MSTSRFVPAVISILILVFIAGCGQQPLPQLGHYEGTNPDVSFDVVDGVQDNQGTDPAVSRFTIKFSPNNAPSYHCT